MQKSHKSGSKHDFSKNWRKQKFLEIKFWVKYTYHRPFYDEKWRFGKGGQIDPPPHTLDSFGAPHTGKVKCDMPKHTMHISGHTLSLNLRYHPLRITKSPASELFLSNIYSQCTEFKATKWSEESSTHEISLLFRSLESAITYITLCSI